MGLFGKLGHSQEEKSESEFERIKRLYNPSEEEITTSFPDRRSGPQTGPLLETDEPEEKDERPLFEQNKEVLKQLRDINSLLQRDHPIRRLSRTWETAKGHVYFSITYDVRAEVEAYELQLPSLSFIKEEPYHISSNGGMGRYNVLVRYYKINLDEYKAAFPEPYDNFRLDQLVPMQELMKGNEDELLNVILHKYRDSIFKVHTRFQESMEVNGELIPKLAERGIAILKHAITEINQAKAGMDRLKELEIQAKNDAAIDDLDMELLFIQDRLVQTIDWGNFKC